MHHSPPEEQRAQRHQHTWLCDECSLHEVPYLIQHTHVLELKPSWIDVAAHRPVHVTQAADLGSTVGGPHCQHISALRVVMDVAEECGHKDVPDALNVHLDTGV